MYDQERQSKSIQCLTKYLQYFKTYFSLSFSLIECHTFTAKFTPVQLQNAIQKITHKKFDITFQQSPFNLWISDNSKSYIDRFYMRIVQFLEYRLNIFKAPDSNQKLSSIINSFIGSFHRFFKNLTSKEFQNNKERTVIGQLFFEIEGMVRKLVNVIFDHLEKNSQKNTANLQQIKFSRKLINEQVFITFIHKLYELQKQREIASYRMNGDSLSNEVYENGKMVLKPRSKSQFRVDNFYSLGSKSLRQSKMTDLSNYLNISKFYKNSVEFQKQKSQNFNKKSVFAQNLSIMDIQEIQVYSRDYIMEELERKNAINKQMIKKYIQVYKKKEKKLKRKAQFAQQIEIQYKKGLSAKRIDILNFEIKSKSEISVKISQEKVPTASPIPTIKGNPIFAQNKSSIKTVKIENVSKPLTQGNMSKALHILEEKQQNKSRSQNIRQQIIKKTTVNQNPEFETNRETFAFKEKQKMYFQSLKNKMTFQDQKITSKLQSIRSQNETTVRKIDKISIPTTIETPPNDYRKMFRNNIKKKGTKATSFLSNKTDDRIKGSNSDIFSKNELTSLSIDSNMVSLQGSTLCKRMPKRGKLMKFLHNEDIINSGLVQESSKVSNKNTTKIQNGSYIEPELSVLVLPRISSNKKQLHPQK